MTLQYAQACNNVLHQKSTQQLVPISKVWYGAARPLPTSIQRVSCSTQTGPLSSAVHSKDPAMRDLRQVQCGKLMRHQRQLAAKGPVGCLLAKDHCEACCQPLGRPVEPAASSKPDNGLWRQVGPLRQVSPLPTRPAIGSNG